MKETLRQSWSIFCQAAKVFKSDRKLLVAGCILTVLMVLIYLIAIRIKLAVSPSLFTNMDKEWLQQIIIAGEIRKLAAFLCIHFLYCVSFYFLYTVYISEFLQSKRQQPVNWCRGFSFGLRRIKIILPWSLLITTVWFVLDILQCRYGFPGIIAGKTVAYTWAAACCFDVAAIVTALELDTPKEILQSSLKTLRKTWGKVITGVLFYLPLIAGWGIIILIFPADVIITKMLLALEITAIGLYFLILITWEAYMVILYQKTREQLPGGEAAPANEPQTALQTE